MSAIAIAESVWVNMSVLMTIKMTIRLLPLFRPQIVKSMYSETTKRVAPNVLGTAANPK